MDCKNMYLTRNSSTNHNDSEIMQLSDFYNDKKMPHNKYSKSFSYMTVFQNKILFMFSVLGLVVIFINIYWLRQMQSEHMKTHSLAMFDREEKRPVLWVYAKNTGTGYLQHVFYVFNRIGFRVGTEESSWDVLWAHDYPFVKLQSTMQNLKVGYHIFIGSNPKRFLEEQ